MADNLTIALKLLLDGRDLDRNLDRGTRGWRRFGEVGRREIERLSRTWNSTAGTLGKLGLGFGAAGVLRNSARLDQSLMQIRQTAGATREQMQGLRDDLFALDRQYGRGVDRAKEGFNTLVQSGLDWRQSSAAIKAITPASAITGADENSLAKGLTVAGAAYNFDLGQPGKALTLLEQMTVAGRLGNAELENLSDIFARVGVNAKSANLQFGQTLGFVETLSMVERQPERLATLADSTLRLFTNEKYKKAAAKASGVKFYDAKGANRDPADVLSDISKKYQALKTDKARNRFISAAFGTMDLDTQKGLKTLLGSGVLDRWRDFTSQIEKAGGTFANDLKDSLDNAEVQAGRVRAILGKVADDLAKPINRTFATAFEQLTRPKAEGGLELDNGSLLGVGAGAVIGGALAKRAMTAALGRIPIIGGALGDSASTAAGLAAGQAVAKAGLGTPVFVTNWPSGGGTGGPGAGVADAVIGATVAKTVATQAGGWLTRLGLASGVGAGGGASLVGGAALASAGVLAAGAGGYEVGGLVNRYLIDGTAFGDSLGKFLASALSPFSAEAREALALRAKNDPLIGRSDTTITVALDPNFNAVLKQSRRGQLPDFLDLRTVSRSGPVSQVPYR